MFVSCTSNLYDFWKCIMFLQKWISNLQDLPRSQSLETSPSLHCLAVLPTWRCLYSFVWWILWNQSIQPFVTSLGPFCDGSCKFVHWPCNVRSSNTCQVSAHTLWSCWVVLFANSQHRSTHFFACPAMSWDHDEIRRVWGNGNFCTLPEEFAIRTWFCNCPHIFAHFALSLGWSSLICVSSSKCVYMCVKLRVHFGSILGPFWVHFGSILGPFWVHFGSILGPFWVHFGSILGPFWVHSGSILGPFWVHFGSILGPFWVHFGSILGPFWVHSGSILGPFWVHFGSISLDKNRYSDKNQCLDKNTL